MNHFGHTIICCVLSMTLPFASSEVLAEAEQDVLEFWNTDITELGNMRLTSIATGTSTPLDKSAAIATVITQEDIEAIGATDLDQVLETVPGLHVGRSDQLFSPKYNIRGINSRFNAQTLVLIDGRAITGLVFGNRGNTWGGMPLKSVHRIEVIRGPGSALYGADAFAGVINIVTKKADNIDGPVATLRLGSFDTLASSYQNSIEQNGYQVSAVIEHLTTDGWNEKISSDQQSIFDAGSGSNISVAPGSVNTGRDQLEAHFNIKKSNTSLGIHFQGRTNLETGPGIAQALDPNGKFDSNRLLVDARQRLSTFSDSWLDEIQLSYYFATQESVTNNLLFPRGAFGGAYPNGFIGNPEYKEENVRLDYKTRSQEIENHIVTIGVGLYYGDIFEVTETKNFFPDFSPRPGGIEDVSDTPEVWMPEKDRNSHYFFLQDEWQIKSDLQLTSGVRYDKYSDFGEAINPRFALVWANSASVTTKILYGKAFRAPSISELFVTSNPVNLGNPDLSPEEIDTYELAISHRSSDKLRYSANVFYYQIEDYIVFESSGGGTATAQNNGEQTGRGFELELEYSPYDAVNLIANYSYQNATNEISNSTAADTPQSDAYFRLDWTANSNNRISTQANFIGSQHRVEGDTRDKVPSYATMDFTYRWLNAGKNTDLKLSIQNLFDAKVFEPSPGPTFAIENDFPMPGIQLYAELSHRF